MNAPLLVTAAMIINKNKILLVKRAREPYKGFWSFVGGCGAFEDVSDPVDAVKIEVKCDLNCEFEPAFFKYSYTIFKIPAITLFFYGTIKGTPKITPKYVLECKWFDLNEAINMKLGFDHNEILSDFLKTFPHGQYKI